MDTPAAALIRRTETPSWPYCLRQLKVASTNASRRTAGVARWNFGTCRLVAIKFLFLGLYRSGVHTRGIRLGGASGDPRAADRPRRRRFARSHSAGYPG